MKALGAAIRDQRKQLGLTQEELAARMAELGDENIRQSDISRFENGQVQFPRFERLNLLTQALEMALGDLLIRAGWASEEMTALTTENGNVALHKSLDEPVPPSNGGPVDERRDETAAEAPEQPRTAHEQFERNRAQFEYVRLRYEEARAEYERRMGSESSTP